MKRSEQISIGLAALAAAGAAVVTLSDTSEAPATEPLADECEVAQAHGPASAWGAIGVEPPPHGYGLIESCAVVPEGAEPFAAERAAGLTITGTTPKKEPRGKREKKARAWGRNAPFDCACRPLSDTGACRMNGEPAPLGRYLPAGSWSGPCVRVPCDELAGAPSFPDECLPPRPAKAPP